MRAKPRGACRCKPGGDGGRMARRGRDAPDAELQPADAVAAGETTGADELPEMAGWAGELRFAMNPKAASALAYGGSWAVVMSLPPLLGWWAIPAALALLVMVGLLAAILRRRADLRAAEFLRHHRQRYPGRLHIHDPEA